MTQHRILQNTSPYFITTNCFAKEPLFCHDNFAEILMQNIFLFCRQYQFTLYGYCIMPDHLHMLLRSSPAYNVSRIMGAIKSKTVTDLYKIHLWDNKLWHPRFRSRIINSRQEFETVLRYIRNNPVRAELEPQWQQLPYFYICRSGFPPKPPAPPCGRI